MINLLSLLLKTQSESMYIIYSYIMNVDKNHLSTFRLSFKVKRAIPPYLRNLRLVLAWSLFPCVIHSCSFRLFITPYPHETCLLSSFSAALQPSFPRTLMSPSMQFIFVSIQRVSHSITFTWYHLHSFHHLDQPDISSLFLFCSSSTHQLPSFFF